jgi:F-type H+-transporting ATPase subunit alpha
LSENPVAGIKNLSSVLEDTFPVLERILQGFAPELKAEEVGTVASVGPGIARVTALPSVRSEELVRFAGNRMGMAFNLDLEETGIILLDRSSDLKAGDEVYRTGRVLDVPVGDALLGRVLDALGRPLDGRGPVRTGKRRPVEREAPGIMDRAPVTVPLQTGLKAVDALIPIGRGQRELILGDRQTGKTAIALDTMINQKDRDVLCIYCAIGKQSAAVAKVIADLGNYGVLDDSIVVFSSEEDPPGLQFIAPYAATSMGEYFMEQGRDVLVVYDDLTRHARAYRELSLLLRRPPGREAYPGDIFYIHSRLLERSTHLKEELGGGSLSALPIVETEAQNISAYIPTNLISITDGQIYLSPELFQKGILPAVDVGKSVSRVGGKTQLPAYRAVAGDLRLSYSQFEELESFARFGTRLDEETRKNLERGRRVREVLKQPQYRPIPVPEQIGILLAVTSGRLDDIPVERIGGAEKAIRETVARDGAEIGERIRQGEKLSSEDREALLQIFDAVIQPERHADPRVAEKKDQDR